MKRVIKFRAKPSYKSDKSFVYGSYLEDDNLSGTSLIMNLYHKSTAIEIDTLGQFTGVTDKNGIEIYEGDICKVLSDLWYCDIKYTGTVVFDLGAFIVENKSLSKGCSVWSDAHELEIIGNIHENKNLIQ